MFTYKVYSLGKLWSMLNISFNTHQQVRAHLFHKKQIGKNNKMYLLIVNHNAIKTL